MSLPSRSEVPHELTWDVTALFQNEGAFESALQNVEWMAEQLKQTASEPIVSPEQLLQRLDSRDAFLKQAQKVYTYAELRMSEDATNPESQTRMGLVEAFANRMAESLSILRSSVAQIPLDSLQAYRADESRLNAYSTWLNEVVHEAEHRLSDDAEALLASLYTSIR